MLKRRNKKAKYAVGGVAGEMNELLAEGGMMDNSGEVINGTEVPPGSLREEVADDVPAMLSEGEFVVPADVVRYVGLERLMKMRDKAKEGLERMEEMGQMGNAQEVENPDQQFSQMDDIDFENDIDSIMGEVDRESADVQTRQMFADGGVVGGSNTFMSGSDISKAVKNPAVDVRYYKHDDGRVMYVTHINGRPMTVIPNGFKQVTLQDLQQVGKKADEASKENTSGITDDNAGGDGVSNATGTSAATAGTGPTGLAATGLGLMAFSENIGKAPTISGQVAKGLSSAAGKGFADMSIAQTTSGFEAMQSAAAVPGMMSVSGPEGQVSTMSTPASVAAADAATFGAVSTGIGIGDVSEAAETGMTSVDGVTVSNDATVAAQNEAVFGPPADADDADGGGGGGKIICTKLYELGLMDEAVYEADQAYGALVAANDPALMNGYHYWANIVVDWMSGTGVRVIPFVSDAKHGAIAAKWATSWAQEIATPWAEHMQYEMGGRKEDSKIGKALMAIGGPISRLFANKKKRPSTLTAIGCIATFVTLYAFVKVAKLFTK